MKTETASDSEKYSSQFTLESFFKLQKLTYFAWFCSI